MIDTVAAANGEINTPLEGLKKISNILSGSGNTSSGERVILTATADCPGSKVTSSESSE